jgi:TonB family protein
MRSIFGQSKPQETVRTPKSGLGKPKLAAKVRPPAVNAAGQVSLFPGSDEGVQESSDPGVNVFLKLIVEQACLATGATGAAIALTGQDEMVCRATVGTTAPVLGARFELNRGITGLCVSTQEIQRCEDAWIDSRVDPTTSRQLGVRSLLILPLVRQGAVAGLFELFSSRVTAFSDRDEQTLIALSSRVLQKLERVAGPPAEPIFTAVSSSLASAPLASTNSAPISSPIPSSMSPRVFAPVEMSEPREASPRTKSSASSPVNAIEYDAASVLRPRRDVLGIVLSLAIALCALLLVAVVAIHPNLRLFRTSRTSTNASVPATSGNADAADAGSASSSNARTAIDEKASTNKAGTYSAPGARPSSEFSAAQRSTAAAPLPPGSLQVFEKGREVFRMLPDGAAPLSPSPLPTGTVQKAALIELSPDAVDRNVIHRVEPRYPQEAIALKIEGTVALDVLIGPNGLVETIKPQSGDPLLAQAASEAVRQWRFRQQFVDGKAAAMQGQVRLNFMLPR